MEELQQKTKLDQTRMQKVTEFLKKCGFVSQDEMKTKVILDKIVREFLEATP